MRIQTLQGLLYRQVTGEYIFKLDEGNFSIKPEEENKFNSFINWEGASGKIVSPVQSNYKWTLNINGHYIKGGKDIKKESPFGEEVKYYFLILLLLLLLKKNIR
jgi:hypothetical protein